MVYRNPRFALVAFAAFMMAVLASGIGFAAEQPNSVEIDKVAHSIVAAVDDVQQMPQVAPSDHNHPTEILPDTTSETTVDAPEVATVSPTDKTNIAFGLHQPCQAIPTDGQAPVLHRDTEEDQSGVLMSDAIEPDGSELIEPPPNQDHPMASIILGEGPQATVPDDDDTTMGEIDVPIAEHPNTEFPHWELTDGGHYHDAWPRVVEEPKDPVAEMEPQDKLHDNSESNDFMT